MKRFEKIKDRIQEKIVVSKSRLTNVFFCECDYKKGKIFPLENLKSFSEKDRWGGKKDAHYFFRAEVDCPNISEELQCQLEVLTDKDLKVNPQVMVYEDGRLIWGVDNEHKHVPLESGKVHTIYLYAYDGANALYDEWLSMDLSLRIIRKNTEQLFYDFEYLLQWLDLSDVASQEYYRCVSVLDKATSLLDFLTDDEKTFAKSVDRARELIAKEIFSGQTGNKERVACVGNSHIDVGWLWPVSQAFEKAQHTAASMLTLMKEYPEFTFFGSQPALYEAIKREDSDLYSEIKKQIKRGAWEADGAMWVQADCNMPSGESLIRQILIGKRFFKEEFGVDSHILWLPDSFGFSAALPQILKKSDITAFITSKLSWGDTNVMPNDLFNWKGIDGSEILSYFITGQEMNKTGEFVKGTAYGSLMNVSFVKGTYNRFLNKDLYNETLLPYGWGDGGGGPSKPFLESARRIEKGNLPMPRLIRKSLSQFVCDLQTAVKNKKLPVWYGELYLELHRGIFVSQSKTKKNNRKCEFLLQNTEFLKTLCECLLGEKYETDSLTKFWIKLLSNQFHDILPGSGISQIYRDADKDYLDIKENVGKMQHNCLKNLTKQIQGKGLCVFNTWSGITDAVIKIGEEYRFVKGLPAKGYAVKQVEALNSSVKVTDKSVANDFFIIEFNDFSDMVRVFDKRKNRELNKAGRVFNEIFAFEDDPHEFDAWELKKYSYDKQYPIEFVSKTVVREGCRSGFEIVKKIGKSTFTQKIFLYENLPLIDFETTVDWKETHILLKAAFPLNLNAYTGRGNIQFGYLQRNLHVNTSWEKACYEVCAHRYFDISESDYGVSVLNDSKYGYGIYDGEINLSLLRAPTYPDENADKGIHTFRYAVYVHDGFDNSDVEKAAYLYNNPPVTIPVENETGSLPSSYSFVSTDKENIVVDTIKKSESGDGYILRFYESKNIRTNCEIKIAVPFNRAVVCDLMENEETVLQKFNKDTLKLTVKPFEIITLKISV